MIRCILLNLLILISLAACADASVSSGDGSALTADSPQLIAQLGRGALNDYSKVRWSPDGEWLAIGGFSGVCLYRRENLNDVPICHSSSPITALGFSPDSQTLAFGQTGGTVSILSLQSSIILRTLTGFRRFATGIVFGSNGTLAIGDEQSIRLYSISSDYQIEREIQAPQIEVYTFQASEDLEFAAAGSSDGAVYVWEIASGNMRYVYRNADDEGPGGEINTIVFDTNRGLVISGNNNGIIRAWSLDSGNEVWNLSLPIDVPVTELSLDPSRTVIASGDRYRQINIWDIDTQAKLGTLDHANFVESVAFSPDGSQIAGLDNGGVSIWDVATRSETYRTRDYSEKITDLAFLREGEELAAASSSSTAVWNIQSRQLSNYRNNAGAAPTMAGIFRGGIFGDYLISRFYPYITIYDLMSGEVIQSFNSDQLGSFSSIALSPTGDLIASGSFDGRISIWDVASMSTSHTLVGQTGTIRLLNFSPDGTLLASGSDESLMLWDVTNGSERITLPCRVDVVLYFSPDGDHLLCAEIDLNDSHTLRIWDTSTFENVQTLSLPSRVLDVAVDPRTSQIAMAMYNGSIQVRDIRENTLRFTLEHSAPNWYENLVTSVAYSFDGRILASGDSNGIIRLWSIP